MEPSAAAATGSPADRDARSAPCHLSVSRPCAHGSARHGAVRQAAGSAQHSTSAPSLTAAAACLGSAAGYGGFCAGHATPSHAIREWADGRERGRQRTASRAKLGRTRRPCPCRCGGRGASRSRCARSRGGRIGTCECLLFEPTHRLGAAARGTTRPSTWRSLRCPQARGRTRRCRSRCCICEPAWRSGGWGTGPTPRSSERRSD